MIEVYKRECKSAELKPYDHFATDGSFMEVCDWSNGEGFDVTIDSVKFSLTFGQWECLQALRAYRS